MRKKVLFTLLIFATLTVLTTACNKDNGCYDEALYQKHKDDICTMDCPGVIGCDGNTYCNECMARASGITVK